MREPTRLHLKGKVVVRLQLFKFIYKFICILYAILFVEIKANDFKANYNKKRIELESAEFEKKFDCFADNKIIALQILTPEIIYLINEFSNTINVPIEISIINDIIYFRILIKDIYTPPKIGNPLSRANIKLLYEILFETKKLVTNISNNMMQIQFFKKI